MSLSIPFNGGQYIPFAWVNIFRLKPVCSFGVWELKIRFGSHYLQHIDKMPSFDKPPGTINRDLSSIILPPNSHVNWHAASLLSHRLSMLTLPIHTVNWGGGELVMDYDQGGFGARHYGEQLLFQLYEKGIDNSGDGVWRKRILNWRKQTNQINVSKLL